MTTTKQVLKMVARDKRSSEYDVQIQITKDMTAKEIIDGLQQWLDWGYTLKAAN